MALTKSLSDCQGPLAHCSETCWDLIVRSQGLRAVMIGGKDLDGKSGRILTPHTTVVSFVMKLVVQRAATLANSRHTQNSNLLSEEFAVQLAQHKHKHTNTHRHSHATVVS